jgi:hypothetical protein
MRANRPPFDGRRRGTGATTWTNPTKVYVDSISVTTPTLSLTFDTASSVSSTPSTVDLGGQVLWLASGSSDTSASNVTLGWLATCP